MATKSGLVSTALRTVSLASEKEIHNTLASIQKQCAQKRAELYELIKDDVVEFKQQVDFTLNVKHQLKEVENEFEKLSAKIKGDVRGKILNSSSKKQEIEGKLTETAKLIQFLTCLLSIYENFTSSWKDLEVENFCVAACKISKALAAINDIGDEGKNAQIFVSLRHELSQRYSKLKKMLYQKWNNVFHWEPKKFTSVDKLKVTLLVTKEQMPEVFEAMKALGIWEDMVRTFARQLLTAFCTPLVNSQDQLIAFDDRNKAVLLSFKPTESPRGISNTFSCLLKFFQFVHDVVPDDHQQSWLSIIQMEVQETLPNLLIGKCLADSVPSSVEGLQHYNQVITWTEEFEQNLVKLNILPVDFNQLSKYVRNINVHFSKKQVEDILVQTRNILTRPLHSTKLVKQKDVLENLSTLGSTPPVQNFDSLEEIFSEEELDSKLFHFPTCHVSESVLEFVQLLYNSLLKCTQSSGSAAVQLFHTCRDMLDLYCAIVPSCHKKIIVEIPRVAAVHHNNCLYVAHHLLTLGHQFQAKLPPPLNSGTSTFVDFIPKLQQLGEETFLCELRKQRDITLQPIKIIGSFENISYKERQLKIQKSLEQSLLHIGQVSSVFHEVLPLHVHMKSTGALIDSLVTCFIEKVTCLEDISEEDSTVLYSFIQNILQKIGSVFQAKKSTQSIDPSSVCSHFAKLEELGFILSATLVAIVDGWQSGHLSKYFTALELRSLIKAIFQNTDHRAKSLAKITA